jgi:hypothetical protein
MRKSASNRVHLLLLYLQRTCDLQKRLDKWTSMESTTWSWCVGGSLAATYAGRDADGRTTLIKLMVCRREDWAGGKRSNKLGNSCTEHCDGILLSNANINGKIYHSIVLKKCTWLRCCYGKKPYGNPPVVPWCDACEFQKRTNGDKISQESAKSLPSYGQSTENPEMQTGTLRPLQSFHVLRTQIGTSQVCR